MQHPIVRNVELLSGVTAVVASAPYAVGDMTRASLQFVGMDTGDTAQIQVSNELDPENWVSVGDAVEDDEALVELPVPARWVRVNRSAGDSAVTVILHGLIHT